MKFPRRVHHNTTVAAVLIIIHVAANVVAGQEQTMAAAVAPSTPALPYACERGTCQNGIFSTETCGCQCIPPYCPDLIGDCTQPTNSCGGNPWTECVKGVDCPWWVNGLSAEQCTTGHDIPLSLWKIYSTREACCNQNYPESKICNGPVGPEAPTKFPTIGIEDVDDDSEIVPLRFDITGLPSTGGLSMSELKSEMKTVLTRILYRLMTSIDGLLITNIEQAAVLNTHETSALGEEEGGSKSVYFNVNAKRVEGEKLGPIIIGGIRDNYDEILQEILTFSDAGYFNEGVTINICAMQNGKYDGNCVKEITSPPVSAPISETDMMFDKFDTNSDGIVGKKELKMGLENELRIEISDKTVEKVILVFDSSRDGILRKNEFVTIGMFAESVDDVNSGLAPWAISLIVLFILVLVFCIGYAIGVVCFGITNCFDNLFREKEPRLDNRFDNEYFDGLSKEAGASSSSRSRRTILAIEDGRYDNRSRVSRRTRNTVLALENGGGRDARSSRAGASSSSRDDRNLMLAIENGSQAATRALPESSSLSYATTTSGSRRTTRTKQSRVGRDPTFYIPGQEDKPDPTSSGALMITQGREPTMYIDNQAHNDSLVVNDRFGTASYTYHEDPPLKAKRDPTMYVDGNRYGDFEMSKDVLFEGDEDEDDKDDHNNNRYDGDNFNSSYFRTESVATRDPSVAGWNK